MSRERILRVVGGLAAFTAVVAAGAFAIVNLAPPEQPIATAKGALLMEATLPPRAFDEPAKLSLPPPPADLRELPVRTEGTGATPSPDSAAASIARDPSGGPPGAVGRPSGTPLKPVAPAPEKTARPIVAALPPDARLPGPEPRPSLAPRPERRADGVLTPAEIRRFRLSLRLTREQEPYWLPVEQALAEIGTQQAALVRAGQDPKDAFGIGAAMRIYPIARPLLAVLREDQKARLRDQARAMGFGSVASSI